MCRLSVIVTDVVSELFLTHMPGRTRRHQNRMRSLAQNASFAALLSLEAFIVRYFWLFSLLKRSRASRFASVGRDTQSSADGPTPVTASPALLDLGVIATRLALQWSSGCVWCIFVLPIVVLVACPAPCRGAPR